jgi:hypothetical protein
MATKTPAGDALHQNFPAQRLPKFTKMEFLV